MTPVTIPPSSTGKFRWTDRLKLASRLAAGIPFEFPWLNVDHVAVLSPESIVDFRCWSNAERSVRMWLLTRGGATAVGIRIPAHSGDVGMIRCWTSEGKEVFSTLVALRPWKGSSVGKARLPNSLLIPKDAVCLLILGSAADRLDGRGLSSVAVGLANAYGAADRNAWVAWIGQQVALGRLSRHFATRVVGGTLKQIKVVNRSVKTAVGSVDHKAELFKLLSVAGVFEHDTEYRVPAGLLTRVHVNTTRICENNWLIDDVVNELLREVSDLKYNAILSTSWQMATIARRLRRLRPYTELGEVQLYETEGYPPTPTTAVAPGAHVLVLTDVVLTGGLIDRAKDLLLVSAACVAGCVCLVDGTASESRQYLRSLWRMDVGCRRDSETAIAVPTFNADRGGMTLAKRVPRSPSEFLQQFPEAAEFWRVVDALGAYEHHRVEGAVHYLGFVDTEKLLRSPAYAATLLPRLIHRVMTVSSVPDVVLVPDRRRARLLGEELIGNFSAQDRLWPPLLVLAEQINGHYRLSNAVASQLNGAKVLIADTATSHGATIDELHMLAQDAGAVETAVAVLISRLSEAHEHALSERLSHRFVRLFNIPIRPISVPRGMAQWCVVCRSRTRVVEVAERTGVSLVRRFAQRMSGRRIPKSELSIPVIRRHKQLDLVVRAYDSPLIGSCRRATASGVTLHAFHTSLNNGMAPLSLPELLDDAIPAKNRAAMLACLPARALSQKNSVLTDEIAHMLAVKPPDEAWAEAVRLLAMTGDDCWWEVFTRRLEHDPRLWAVRSEKFWGSVAIATYYITAVGAGENTKRLEQLRVVERVVHGKPAAQGIAAIIQVLIARERQGAVVGSGEEVL